jgi:hypothetical protein
MRIKMYENFTSNTSDKIREDIEDIFVELLDIGYDVVVDCKLINMSDYYYCEVRLSKADINFDVIRESCMMFEDYISDKSPKDLKYYNNYKSDSHFPLYDYSTIKYIKIAVYINI